MVEGARLESVCTVILYREFESLTLRHFFYSFLGCITECSFQGRASAPGSCARQSHEPRQVRKEAAISGPLSVPRGCLGAAARRWKEQRQGAASLWEAAFFAC